MTQNEKLQIAVIKNNQDNMKVVVAEMKDIQKEQSDDIKEILARLDSLSGGKQALIWITATFIGIAAVIGTFLDAYIHHKK